MTSHIDSKLDIYGPSRCPICGDYRETIYAGERYQLTCRKHPGHPLFREPGKHEAGVKRAKFAIEPIELVSV